MQDVLRRQLEACAETRESGLPGFQRCSEFVAQEFQYQAPLVGPQ